MVIRTPGRRQVLGGLLATGLLPAPTWADAGSPAFLSAAARADGGFVLCGIGDDLRVLFQKTLPARGHAAAAHPTRPEAVAFARRPGTFALVIDCLTGAQKAALTSPAGRHFYGHGAFSADGTRLFTTENDYELGRGRIGVWDANSGYTRIDEWDSGGIGPHDIKRLPGTDVLVVANGGIDTHPETGRTKLNIPTMKPNLTYLDQGVVVDIATLPAALHKNSIRHLAVGPQGQVVMGLQWQGDGQVPALVATHRRGAAILTMEAPAEQTQEMDGYIGSIAFSSDGTTVAVTSPRGGRLHRYDAQTRRFTASVALADVCGVAPLRHGFAVSTGTGRMQHFGQAGTTTRPRSDLMWDNHLVALPL